ncbi:PREDICTED: wall-associated receptor kinase-like 22-like [Fragaria vesca subsp. vesca]
MVFQILLHATLLVWSVMMSSAILAAAQRHKPSIARPHCQPECGGIEIPYPFGMGTSDDCYLSDSFQIYCDNSTDPPKPFLYLSNSKREVLEISLAGTLKVMNPISFFNCSDKEFTTLQPASLVGTSYVYSQRNRFTSMSCGAIAYMMSWESESIISGCLSICDPSAGRRSLLNNSCTGIHCCQTTIPAAVQDFYTDFRGVELAAEKDMCKFAFLVDQDWFTSDSTNISAINDEMDSVPIVLDWDLSNYTIADIVGTEVWWGSDYFNRTAWTGSQCYCLEGFRGNPYLIDGCQDINECREYPNICGRFDCFNFPGGFFCNDRPAPPQSRFHVAIIVTCSVLAILIIHTCAWWLQRALKKRKIIKRKQKFFKQNGGLLLEQQLSSGEVNVEKIKLFNSKELEKATDHFNVDRVLGQGGQGTVYKGMLADGKIVAVKKSVIANGGEVRQFINEIVVLSQIIHRNVVKLLGCCLETEVPLLVYEFIPNGTLYQYIQHQNEEFPLTWKMRLRVAIEVAGALFYLHSAASTPIYHRDIKSSNILLDDKYRVKVADFGTSRSVSIEKTHLTMSQVQGTFGYLDPEYFRTNQFTDKSDVYSFGVVLAELLTGEKPIMKWKSEEATSLANYFLVSLEDDHLFDILDARLVKDGGKEVITEVAYLAKRCLNLKGKKRPTMKEVAMELERIVNLYVNNSDVQSNSIDVGYD